MKRNAGKFICFSLVFLFLVVTGLFHQEVRAASTLPEIETKTVQKPALGNGDFAKAVIHLELEEDSYVRFFEVTDYGKRLNVYQGQFTLEMLSEMNPETREALRVREEYEGGYFLKKGIVTLESSGSDYNKPFFKVSYVKRPVKEIKNNEWMSGELYPNVVANDKMIYTLSLDKETEVLFERRSGGLGWYKVGNEGGYNQIHNVLKDNKSLVQLSPGTYKIFASGIDRTHLPNLYSFRVSKVEKKVKSIKIKAPKKIKRGEFVEIGVEVFPKDASVQDVEITSYDVVSYGHKVMLRGDNYYSEAIEFTAEAKDGSGIKKTFKMTFDKDDSLIKVHKVGESIEDIKKKQSMENALLMYPDRYVDYNEQLSAGNYVFFELDKQSGDFHKAIYVEVKYDMIDLGSLEPGATLKVKEKDLPSGYRAEDLRWNSSNGSAVSVDGYGEITAEGRGEALITLETEDGKKLARAFLVRVETKEEKERRLLEEKIAKAPKATGFKISGVKVDKKNKAKKVYSIKAGKSATLKVSALPKKAYNSYVNLGMSAYTSDTYPEVFSDKIKITAGKYSGIAVIGLIGTSKGEEIYDSFVVETKGSANPSATISKLNLKKFKKLKLGKTKKLSYHVIYKKNVSWKQAPSYLSTNSYVGYIDGNGYFHAENEGKTTIYIYDPLGTAWDCFEVQVVK